MTNIRLRDIEGYEKFKSEYVFFSFEKEYPGWTGVERYAIISQKSIREIENEFPAVIEAMRPVIVLGEDYAAIRNESIQNERKAKRFQMYHCSDFNFDEETEYKNKELNDYFSCENMDYHLEIEEAMGVLTETQRRRTSMYYFDNFNYREIAEIEHVDITSVKESIYKALSKMKEFFECTPQNSL